MTGPPDRVVERRAPFSLEQVPVPGAGVAGHRFAISGWRCFWCAGWTPATEQPACCAQPFAVRVTVVQPPQGDQ